jgi:fluoride exporter
MLLFLRYSVFVALGGAVGAVLRFWSAEFIHLFFERGFPIGTMFVNVIGSFAMGFLAIYLFHKFTFSQELKSFLLIGLLGAFTTFSIFSLDTVNLFLGGKFSLAIMNIVLSVVLCVIAAGLGLALGYSV